MLKCFRVIPILLLKKNGFYKTKQFKNPVYLGDPINIINIFNSKGVDELMILDIEASLINKINYQLIKELNNSCFVPLCYGGGVRSISEAESLIKIGVEKINICSNLAKIGFIEDLVNNFGSSSVVATINISKSLLTGSYNVVNNELNIIEENVKDYINKIIDKGIGELVINNVTRDGMRNGIDIKLISHLSFIKEVPVVWVGGIKNTSEIIEISRNNYNNVNALGVGASFVFYGKYNAVLIQYLSEDEKNQIIN